MILDPKNLNLDANTPKPFIELTVSSQSIPAIETLPAEVWPWLLLVCCLVGAMLFRVWYVCAARALLVRCLFGEATAKAPAEATCLVGALVVALWVACVLPLRCLCVACVLLVRCLFLACSLRVRCVFIAG